MLDRNLLTNLLYSTFVLPQTTEQNDIIHVIEVEVIHELNITTKKLLHKTYIALHPEIVLAMSKILLLHNTLDHDMTTINEIHDHIALLKDLLPDSLTGMTLVLNIDHVHNQEITTILQNTYHHGDHLHDQEKLDILDHDHIPIQGINLIQNNHNTKMTQLTSKYTCIIQLKWQRL